MKFFHHSNLSADIKHTVVTFFAIFFIGLLLGLAYLAHQVINQSDTQNILAKSIITSTKQNAIDALWKQDVFSAEKIAKSILLSKGVSIVTLKDSTGKILAEHKQSVINTHPLIFWLAKKLSSTPINRNHQLAKTFNRHHYHAGVISFTLDSTPIMITLINHAIAVLICLLVQALVVTLWLQRHRTQSIILPLRKISSVLKTINPDNPGQITLPSLSKHTHHDVEKLQRHSQKMLKRIFSSQEKLRNLATRDPLTDQPNRILITDRLKRALDVAKRNETLVAILFLDLNKFKSINDTLGHDVGDMLLIETANRLTEILRSNDSVGRLGGDEFLLVLEGVNEVSEIVRMVQRITDALGSPYSLQGHEVCTSASIGISVYPNDGDDFDELMRCADLAMYEAKGTETHWHFFAKEMSDRVDLRLKTESALNHAVERDEFYLCFQPKIETQSGNLAGCEALLRWKKEPDSLAKGEFISIAEESGSIVKIGTWVIEEVCRQINIWKIEYGNIPVSINISAKQLQDPNFVKNMLAIMKNYHIPAELIELEITETVLLKILEESLIVLGELRKAGITISIDDFGTGYSSLSYLTQLPVDILKIDQSFVSGEQRSKAVLEMIVAIAKTLQLKTVAEGVETQGQRDWLSYEGCDFLQGYLISKAVLPETFEQKFLQPLLVLDETY